MADTLEEIKKKIKAFPPISKMTHAQFVEGINLMDKRDALIRKENAEYKPKANTGLTINREVSFTNGPVLSHADGKRYSNRKSWDDHLKAHGCQEVGNDYKHMLNKTKSEVRGDFNVRRELTQATREVMDRHGG